jgi:hypothetical protein
LATTDDARVHCAVLKIRAVPVSSAPDGGASRSWSRRPRKRPFPQDPTACSARLPLETGVPCRVAAVLTDPSWRPDRITSAPLMSSHLGTYARDMALDASHRQADDRASCSLERR